MLPAELLFSHATTPCAGGFPCQLGELAAGAVRTIEVHLSVPVDYSGPQSVSASATVTTPHSIDPVPGNDQDQAATVILSGYPVLGLAKAATAVWNESTSAFDITYTLYLSNTGETEASFVELSADLAVTFGTVSYSNLSTSSPELSLIGSHPSQPHIAVQTPC